LVLALSGEMGELCECFQWKGDHISVDGVRLFDLLPARRNSRVLWQFSTDWSASEREHLGEELSDVAIYLIRLADRCNIDLASAIQDKIVKNALKYPAHLVREMLFFYGEGQLSDEWCDRR
jgi:dCTP diphosphatase